jgi:hypothetical protein
MSYSIVEADIIKHKDVILSLLKNNFSEVIEQRYAWIYENNPSGAPISYLLKDDVNDVFVGAVSLFPRNLVINGTPFKALICGDFVVDYKHRSLGPALLLLKSAITRCNEVPSCILLGFPNVSAEKVTLKAGFEAIGEYISMVKVLRTHIYINRYISSGLFSRYLSYPFDLLIYIRSVISSLISYKRYKFEITSDFDDRFDCLNTMLLGQFSLRGDMSSRFLQWRYKQSPHHNYSVFTMTHNFNKQLLGYIVFTVTNRKVTIADIAVSDSCQYLSSLLESFSMQLISRGYVSIEFSFAGDPTYKKLLVKCGYCSRPTNLIIAAFVPSALIGIISEAKNGRWLITSSDNDT